MKIKMLSIAAAIAVLASTSVQAIVNVTIDGGKGTPLTVNITGGDTFTATGSSSAGGTIYLRFINVWDNAQISDGFTFSSTDISLAGTTSGTLTGAPSSGSVNLSDLVLGFTNADGIAASDAVVLTTGTRITDANLNLDYTTINPTGTVTILNSSLATITGPLTYNASAVPEPSTYAALAGLAALCVVAYRKRRSSRIV